MTATGYLARNTVHIGSVLALAARLEPASVQTIVTSPPYWGLRSYLPADHPDKSDELGSEATPEEYVANLVAVFAALRNCLKDDGVIWLNLGDSFAGGKVGNTNGGESSGLKRDGRAESSRQRTNGRFADDMATMQFAKPAVPGLPPKSLLMIPHRVALALQAEGWVIRQDIIWHKPNPMPESVTDRPTRAHEYLFLIAKGPEYFYDATAIAERSTHAGKAVSLGAKSLSRGQAAGANVKASGNGLAEFVTVTETRNKRSVWTVPTAAFPDAHYATFSPDLIRPCILAGTGERGECAACGKAWVRVAESNNPSKRANVGIDMTGGAARTGNPQTSAGLHRNGGGVYSTRQTTGWRPQCRCNAPTRPQLVLDPFSGSGTTGEVAHEEGRDYLGIDLDARAVRWYLERRARFPLGRLAGV